MAIRSCYYPLIGNRIFGWLGDLIDIIAIVTSLMSVCAKAGLSAQLVNTGMADSWPQYFEEGDKNLQVCLLFKPFFYNKNVAIFLFQLAILWGLIVLTLLTIPFEIERSVLTIAVIGLYCNFVLMFVTLVRGNWPYLINVFVQTTGLYLENFIRLGTK